MQTRRLAIITLITTAGLVLLIGMLQAGTGTAASPTLLPTPPNPLVDDIVWGPLTPHDLTIQRIQTVTLQPDLNDVTSSAWPSRVDDVIYNKPGGTSIRLPLDACNNVTWGLASGTATKRCESDYAYVDLPPQPDPQPWFTVTYQTRTRAARYRELITVTAGAATNPPYSYDPLTVTVVYTRHWPYEREDYWGHTLPVLRGISPTPIEKSDEEGWARWAATAVEVTGSVVISEPLFGSHLTATQLYVSTLTPTVGTLTYFTAVIENRGVMTAFRWFPAELYVRPAYWPAPASISDHVGGVGTHGNYAFLKPFGNPPESPGWKIDRIGPGQSLTLQTAITFMTELGNLRVYAQPDVYFDGDPAHYSEVFGCNPDGYGDTPESNVLAFRDPIFVPIAYRVDAFPAVSTLSAPPGRQATHVIQVRNVGNMTDTYIITASRTLMWTMFITPSPPISLVLPGASKPLTIQVNIPAGIPEETTEQTRLTIQSTGDPSRSRDVWLYTIARKLRIYLPLVLKR